MDEPQKRWTTRKQKLRPAGLPESQRVAVVTVPMPRPRIDLVGGVPRGPAADDRCGLPADVLIFRVPLLTRDLRPDDRPDVAQRLRRVPRHHGTGLIRLRQHSLVREVRPVATNQQLLLLTVSVSGESPVSDSSLRHEGPVLRCLRFH